jgi:phosphatidate cytidylyltransferase
MLKRILTAVIGIAFGIAVVAMHNTIVYPIVVALVAALSVHELLTACECGIKKFPVHYLMCEAFALLLPILNWFEGIHLIWKIFAGTMIVFFLFAGFVADNKKLPFSKLAMMVSVTLLVTLSVSCLNSLVKLSPTHGVCYVVMSLMAAWLPDAGAYFVGSAIGKHKMCPDISPHKTIEGAVGGVVVSVIVFAIYAAIYRLVMAQLFDAHFSVNYLYLSIGVVIAAVISIIGDLSASLIKREYGIKDFGNIFPGHGGMVDRFDSVYFVLPFVMLSMTAFGEKVFF